MKIKGPKDKTMLSIVALLLCSIQFVACQSATGDMLGPVTTDMVIDYDDVNTLFSTGEETESPTTEEEGSSTTARSPTTTQLCSTASVTESGSGSNDLLQPENCITEPCLLVPNGTCCQLPDELTPTPSTHSLTEALNQGLCHSLCVEELATSSVIDSATREMLAGYPVWTLVYQSYFFSEDGISGKDCLLPNNPNGCNLPESCPQIIRQLHDCKQGCMTRLEGVVNKCDRKCVSSCKSQCTDHFISGFGCQVESLPLPCRAVCAKRECKSGCTQGDNYIDNPNSYSTLSGFGVSSGPTHPPNVTHIVDVRYRVDISNAVPNGGDHLSRTIGYSTVVIMVTNEDITRYFVLDDSNEVDLGEFACRTVNISFAVATAKYNVSDFSPSLTIEILNIPDPGAGSCPDQLTENSVNISVEQDNRVGFFQQHIIHVSWSLPNNSQNSNGYSLTLTSFSPTLCGFIGPITIDNTNATDYTFQLSTPDRSDDIAVPPVTRCSYTLRIEVLASCSRGDEIFSTEVHTGQYTTPTSNNTSLLCDSSISHNITAYDITISVVLDETFTPAVMEAISYFQIARIEQDSRGLIIPNGNHLFFNRINHTNETTIETQYFVTLPPTQPGRQFLFDVTVFWNQDLPRNDIIMKVSSSCVISDIGPIPLHPVNSNNISIDSLNLQAIQPLLYRVTIEYNFTYSYPSDGEFPVDFDVTVSYDESIVSREIINGTLRSGSITADIITESDNANFSIILQLRVNTENTESRWSNPLIFPLSTESTRPELVTDKQFNVTSFTYRTSPATSGEVNVEVNVEVNIEIAQNIKALTFEVWVGKEELTTDSNPTAQLFSSNSTIFRVSNSLQLPSLGMHVYVQIRGINLARITGDWSNPELIHIAEIDPPSSIRTRVNEAQLSEDQMSLSIDMDVSWTPSSSLSRRKRQEIREPEISVTMYIIIVGFEPAEGPYSDPPLGSITREIQAGEDLQDTIVDEIGVNMDNITNSTDILTLYVQMRSGSADVMGRWSEYQTIPIEMQYPDIEPDDPLPLILGISIPIGIIITVILVLIILLCAVLIYHQRKLSSLKYGDIDTEGGKWWETNDNENYIAPGLVEGKELVVDDWEIPTTDVIVEDHLGEGAFGLVFKGMIRGPLRNSKLSSKLKQTIGLPVAIKLLKDTATRKERSDFLLEIEMMKKISEGYCANVVNMVGCVTLQEPLCLITEFVAHGDLLDYLRNQRKKNASRKREEKYLRVQLEQQRKAYEEVKRQMEKLQSAQSDEPGEGRLIAGASGYADFPDMSQATNRGPEQDELNSSSSSDSATPASMKADAPLLPPTSNKVDSGINAGTIVADGGEAAPYLESMNEYSHLDPKDPEATTGEQIAETEQDIYDELGDIDGNDLMQFAYQIATGMDYLASISIVHRDLACRNILVGDGKNLKITDFGLSRQVEDVYVKTTKGRLPLKWMSLESIEAREFTTYSDVWSYGVTLWEIGTLGGFPYPTIQNQDLLMMLKQGYRLEKPDNCAPEVYQIMLECWQEHPHDRPSFSMLREKFSNLLLASSSDPYMVLEVDEDKNYYTMAEEEEANFRGSSNSVSSTDTDSGIKKLKEKKKVEKPQWAISNPYVPTPSTFKEDQVLVEDEHYRVPVEVVSTQQQAPEAEEQDEVKEEEEKKDKNHVPLTTSFSLPVQNPLTTPVSLEDQMGIPLSFVSNSTEKPSQQDSSRALRKIKSSNPYVDDPATLRVLPDDEEPQEDVSKIVSLTTEFNQMLREGRGEDEVTTVL